jgi:hypothetical protein
VNGPRVFGQELPFRFVPSVRIPELFAQSTLRRIRCISDAPASGEPDPAWGGSTYSRPSVVIASAKVIEPVFLTHLVLTAERRWAEQALKQVRARGTEHRGRRGRERAGGSGDDGSGSEEHEAA